MIGLPRAILFTEVSEISEMMDLEEMPDKTVETSGQTKAVRFTAKVPAHHTVDIDALESWYKEGQDPVSALYKKSGNYIQRAIDGRPIRIYSLLGCFIYGRSLDPMKMDDNGQLTTIEYFFSADDIIPLT
jgi:hypothetical protein